jgi:two-component system NtrC family sensor kinase
MSIPSFKARFSFQAKVLVPVVAIMVLLVMTMMWLVNLRTTEQLRTEAAQQLDTAENVFKNTQEIRAENLVARYLTLAHEPRFLAVTRTITPDARTLTPFLKDFVEQDHDAQIVLFTRGDGQRFASASRDQRLDVSEFEARSSAAIRQALAGKPKVDAIAVNGRLFDAVSIPVGGDAMTIGVEIGESVVRQIKRVTHSEVLLLMDNQVAASSLAKLKFDPKIAARFSELMANRNGLKDGQGNEMIVEGEHFLCKAESFPSLSADGKLGYMLLSSYEEPLAAFEATKQMLLAVSLMGIVLSTGIVWLVIRKITQPLRQLRDSAEAVGRGDFSRRVEVHSRDECGELSVVFNTMTLNLKTSHEELERTVETLKATQHQLIQSEKLSGIGEFVAGVAHELNNPLTSVMGFSELLQQGELAEPQRRFLDMIFKSAKRCQKIVQSLLSFARRHAPERKVLCVNEVLESAVEILQYQMRTSNIEVKTHLDRQLPATLIDPHQMQQVFLNIINNARQAMDAQPGGGCLNITTEAADGRVRVIFQDNGPGISAENLKKIFNPFFTTKEVGKGTGLGLSLCYGIVTEHGGSITPESKPGEGASFVIDLPITREAAAQAEKAAVPAQPQNAREGVGKRVLVIDDEDSILQMIQEALTVNGYKVDVARDGETALRRLGQYHYDLALCDWKMPGLNGEQVYERLRSSNPEMSRRLIFITGDVVSEKTQEFLQASDKVCLSKPFTLAEFRAAIGRMLSSTAGRANG